MFSEQELQQGLQHGLLRHLRATNRIYSTKELAAGLEYLMQADATGLLPGIRCPILLVHGEADAICPVEGSRLIASRVGGPVRVEILPGAGHVPFYTNPQRCLTAIREWVKHGECQHR
jgi:pimeloyl-[acyl-carrier protein] methyl ester esterase